MAGKRMVFQSILLVAVYFAEIQGNIVMPDSNAVEQRMRNLEELFTTEITHLTNTLNTQNQQIAKANRLISQLYTNIKELEGKINTSMKSLPTMLPDRLKAETKKDVILNEVGCISDTLTMVCYGGATINVTGAIYGQYSTSCADCCSPDLAADCTEDILDKNLEEFIKIKLRCDNESSCEYTYEGEVISDCEEAYVADYMQINYVCVGASADVPAAFTAYTTTDRGYSTGDTILFDEELSNFGGFYNLATGDFTCPEDGIYSFTVNVMNHNQFNVYAGIALDGEVLLEAWADYTSYESNQASGSCITPCLSGQVVHVQAIGDSHVYGQYRRCHFTGYMLHAF